MHQMRYVLIVITGLVGSPALSMPYFGLDPASSSLVPNSKTPDDVYVPGPTVHKNGTALGLKEDLGGGRFDYLDALSYGQDPIQTPLYFSVDRVAVGAKDSAVNKQALPGTEEAAGDVFKALPPANSNSLYIDETELGLTAPATFGDDLGALELDSNPKPWYYFSVDALSESVVSGNMRMRPGDIWISAGDGNRTLFALYKLLGLEEKDDLDALVLLDLGVFGQLEPGIDVALFSLSVFSPSTFTASGQDYGFCQKQKTSPADVCMTKFQSTYTPYRSAAQLGLRIDDELDALDTIPEPSSLMLSLAGLLAFFPLRGKTKRRTDEN